MMKSLAREFRDEIETQAKLHGADIKGGSQGSAPQQDYQKADTSALEEFELNHRAKIERERQRRQHG